MGSTLELAEKRSRGGPQKPLSRLPDELLAVPHEDWEAVDWGLWRFSDHISLGETRTVVRLSRLVSSVPSAQGHRVVSLQDNEACSGALMNGEIPSPQHELPRAAEVWPLPCRRSVDAIALGGDVPRARR